jgi:hypothetical protein
MPVALVRGDDRLAPRVRTAALTSIKAPVAARG